MREQFEKLFPVSDRVEWHKDRYQYKEDGFPADFYNAAWKGFQAGHAAGLEDAATVVDANWHYETAAAIRAMK